MSFATLLLQSPLLWVVALLAVVYWSYLPCLRFRNAGVKYLTPVPLLGNIAGVLFNQQGLFSNFGKLYETFPNERFVGMCEGNRPVVVIRDLELVKRVTVTDFEHFQRQSPSVDQKSDPFFASFIFVLAGPKWKQTRSLLSRLFTGLMLRKQITPIVTAGDRMVGEIRRKIEESKSNYWDTDFNDICFHANFEVIVSCVLGLQLDSRDHSYAKLYDVGTNFFTLGRRQILAVLGYRILPSLMKVTGATMFSKKQVDNFKNLYNNMKILSTGKDKNIEGHDFINILLHTKNELSNYEAFSQACSLMIGSFEPLTAAIGMLVRELALKPDIQERLYQEIQEAERKTGGKIDYATIQEMTYMDMVLSELLRMWSNNTIMRVCTKDYNLGRPNDSATQDYIIRKGEGVYIPMRGVQCDPQYFPEPTKFDPERFSKENRHKIPALAYSPFGMGPRSCVGTKFATCVIKVLTYQLLRHVEVSRCEKTSSTIQLDPSSISLMNKEGMWMRLALRGQADHFKDNVFV